MLDGYDGCQCITSVLNTFRHVKHKRFKNSGLKCTMCLNVLDETVKLSQTVCILHFDQVQGSQVNNGHTLTMPAIYIKMFGLIPSSDRH